ncbi:MAG: hypothetical protein HXX19_07465 [Rhodoferax sp.]|nr:hypothetical protein [Rhodoferax sp.]
MLLALPALVHAGTNMLTTQGYGAVRFGMSIAAAEKAVGQHTRERHSNDCQYVTFRKYPGISFMLEKRVVVRADLDKNLPNSASARLGMEAVRIEAVRDPYREQASDEDYVSYALKTPDGHAALVVETVDGLVHGIWAGTFPAYTYYEGCL